MKFSAPLNCLTFVLSLSLIAQEEPKSSVKSYTTLEIGEVDAPVIDGNLDETIWTSVEWESNFLK